ncbi:monoglyceride lipase-like [Arapaima gigas]
MNGTGVEHEQRPTAAPFQTQTHRHPHGEYPPVDRPSGSFRLYGVALGYSKALRFTSARDFDLQPKAVSSRHAVLILLDGNVSCEASKVSRSSSSWKPRTMNARASCALLAAAAAYLYGSGLMSALCAYVAETLLGMSGSAEQRRVPGEDLEHLVNADGQHLFCRYWEPEAPPRALVFIVHGAGEHCGCYGDLAQSLIKQDLLVFAHDHVGHGKSEGDRMVVKDFQVYVRDSLRHVDLMKERHPGLPIFLVGHSMGGAISILTASERPEDFAGVVLIAPMVQLSPDTASSFKVFAAKLLNHMLPNIYMGRIEPKWISRDQKQVEAYEKDELVYHGGIRVSFGVQLINAVERIEKAIPTIRWPFLMLQGDTDKLCDIKGAQTMFEKAQSPDKELKVYEGAYHALHHELPEVADSVRKEISTWIEKRIPAQSSPGS